MQITDPEDCCGALRSERSFDGVEFKRIIMVWGMKTETVVKLDPLWSASACTPSQKALWFHRFMVRRIHIAPVIILPWPSSFSHLLLVFMKLFQSSCSHNNKTLLDGPKVCFYDSTRCVWFSSKYHCEPLKKTKKLAWPQHPALTVCWRVVHVVPECSRENDRAWLQISVLFL